MAVKNAVASFLKIRYSRSSTFSNPNFLPVEFFLGIGSRVLFKAKQNWRRFFSTANICRILLAFPLRRMFTFGHHTSTWASLKKFYLFWVKTLGVTFVCRKMTQKSENKVFPAFLYFQDWKNFQVVAGMISINNQSRSSFSCLPLDKGI